MGKLLDILATKHSLWCDLARSMKVPEHDVEDVVQDMYLKMANYEHRSNEFIQDGQLTGCNIYLVLRSVWVDSLRGRNETPLTSYEERYDVDLLDEMDVSGYDFNMNAHYNRINASIKQLESNEKFIEDLADEDARFIIHQEMQSWHWYDKALFDLYMSTDMSMRDIAKETKISLTSIYNTLSNGKERIRQAFARSGRHAREDIQQNRY